MDITSLKDFKIKIIDRIWHIKFVEHIPEKYDPEPDITNKELYGVTIDSTNKIFIATKNSNNVSLDKNSILTCLFHELTHAILINGMYLGSNNDECLVEWLAKNWLEIFKKLKL